MKLVNHIIGLIRRGYPVEMLAYPRVTCQALKQNGVPASLNHVRVAVRKHYYYIREQALGVKIMPFSETIQFSELTTSRSVPAGEEVTEAMPQRFAVRRSDGKYLRRHRREGTWRSWTSRAKEAANFHVRDDAEAVALTVSPRLEGTALEIVHTL